MFKKKRCAEIDGPFDEFRKASSEIKWQGPLFVDFQSIKLAPTLVERDHDADEGSYYH
jgi:hypothetical protein